MNSSFFLSIFVHMNRKPGLAVALIVAGFALLYQSFSRSFPFYWIWDMDWVSTLDTLMMQGGDLPDHVNHPGFGMYWVLVWAQRLAHVLGQVSFMEFDSIKHAGNPYLGMAELTDFFRGLSVFGALGILLCLWGVVSRVSSRGFAIAALLILGVQQSLFYHSAMIRTELYSMLFWSMALLLGVAGLQLERERGQKIAFLASGVAIGLSFLSKLQSFILIAWLPLIWIFIVRLGSGRAQVLFKPRETEARLKPVIWVLPALFFILLFLSGQHVLSPGFATFTQEYKINSAAICVGVAYLLPALLWFKLKQRSVALENLLAGFLVAFALHFLIYFRFATGWEYLLTDAKMLFFRTNYQSTGGVGLIRAIEKLARELRFSPVLYLSHFVILGSAAWIWIQSRDRKTLMMLALIEGVLLFQITFGARFILRDLLWKEIPLVIWTLILAAVIWEHVSRKNQVVLMALLLILGGTSICGSWMIRKRMESLYPIYGWDVGKWSTAIFDGREKKYGEWIPTKMGQIKDPQGQEAAWRPARHWREWRQAVSQVLVNTHADFRDVSTVGEGFALPGPRGERVETLSESLRGGLILHLPLDEDRGGVCPYRLEAKEVRTPSELQDKWVKGDPQTPALAFLPRTGLRVWIFSPAERPLTQKEGIQPDSARIRAGGKEFVGYSVSQYAEIPFKEWDFSAFLVLSGI